MRGRLLLYSLAGPPMPELAWLSLVGPPTLGDTWRPPAYAWDLRPALDGSAGLGLVGASAAGMCALAQVDWDRACRYTEASSAAR